MNFKPVDIRGADEPVVQALVNYLDDEGYDDDRHAIRELDNDDEDEEDEVEVEVWWGDIGDLDLEETTIAEAEMQLDADAVVKRAIASEEEIRDVADRLLSD